MTFAAEVARARFFVKVLRFLREYRLPYKYRPILDVQTPEKLNPMSNQERLIVLAWIASETTWN